MKYLFGILLLLICLSAKSQNANNTNRKDTLNIYYVTLSNYFHFLEEKGTLLPDSIFIEDEYKLGTENLLSNVGKTNLVILNSFELLKRLKKQEYITFYRILPLSFKNGTFSVSCIPFRTTYNRRKKMINLSNGGGFEVFYNYFNDEFKFNKVAIYGI